MKIEKKDTFHSHALISIIYKKNYTDGEKMYTPILPNNINHPEFSSELYRNAINHTGPFATVGVVWANGPVHIFAFRYKLEQL